MTHRLRATSAIWVVLVWCVGCGRLEPVFDRPILLTVDVVFQNPQALPDAELLAGWLVVVDGQPTIAATVQPAVAGFGLTLDVPPPTAWLQPGGPDERLWTPGALLVFDDIDRDGAFDPAVDSVVGTTPDWVVAWREGAGFSLYRALGCGPYGLGCGELLAADQGTSVVMELETTPRLPVSVCAGLGQFTATLERRQVVRELPVAERVASNCDGDGRIVWCTERAEWCGDVVEECSSHVPSAGEPWPCGIQTAAPDVHDVVALDDDEIAVLGYEPSSGLAPSAIRVAWHRSDLSERSVYRIPDPVYEEHGRYSAVSLGGREVVVAASRATDDGTASLYLSRLNDGELLWEQGFQDGGDTRARDLARLDEERVVVVGEAQRAEGTDIFLDYWTLDGVRDPVGYRAFDATGVPSPIVSVAVDRGGVVGLARTVRTPGEGGAGWLGLFYPNGTQRVVEVHPGGKPTQLFDLVARPGGGFYLGGMVSAQDDGTGYQSPFIFSLDDEGVRLGCAGPTNWLFSLPDAQPALGALAPASGGAVWISVPNVGAGRVARVVNLEAPPVSGAVLPCGAQQEGSQPQFASAACTGLVDAGDGQVVVGCRDPYRLERHDVLASESEEP